MQQTESADCDECGKEDAVKPFGREYVCEYCDAEMSSARFESAKYE